MKTKLLKVYVTRIKKVSVITLLTALFNFNLQFINIMLIVKETIMFKNLSTSLLSLVLLFTVLSCGSEDDKNPYVKEIREWQAKRVAGLKKPDGWFSLVGLYWLNEGVNTFGSSSENDLVFPEDAPAYIGLFYLDSEKVTVKINEGIEVLSDSALITQTEMTCDADGEPTILEYGTLSWFVIKRSTNKFGIRLRDSESEALKKFESIETFPVDEAWRVEAIFKEYNPPKIINVPSIIGYVEKEESPGALEFTINGKQYSLDVLDTGNRFWLIFGDLTNGDETYGAGRFLYTDKPGTSGKTYIDFNKAYNPPCAFSRYATCPLPPKQNMLRAAITAGEKKYLGSGH